MLKLPTHMLKHSTGAGQLCFGVCCNNEQSAERSLFLSGALRFFVELKSNRLNQIKNNTHAVSTFVHTFCNPPPFFVRTCAHSLQRSLLFSPGP
jgi:hypothetical protein